MSSNSDTGDNQTSSIITNYSSSSEVETESEVAVQSTFAVNFSPSTLNEDQGSTLPPSSPKSLLSIPHSPSVTRSSNNFSDDDNNVRDDSDDFDDDSDDNDDDVGTDSDDDNENRWLHNPIYQNSSSCGGDALIQILKIYVSNQLSKEALSDLLTLLNTLLPDNHNLPKTKFKLLNLIDKILLNLQSNYTTKHRICSDCQNYLGEWLDSQDVKICSRCNGKKLKSFFIEFNIESELRNAFEVRDLHSLIDSFQTECFFKKFGKCVRYNVCFRVSASKKSCNTWSI
ncbi:uncharacterized protein LOC122506320 [Leptopilina heterotoma]|uniref:uncharacterized protein LOC122506320 n=1 Tax=Leptopilina heterotoma TaxID=63436 RepID=UPI001CA9178A|nr:uncharacterized protein LOC122506320 [Leptopilina heterotoma]XP_043474371.1 uncharacterized protein LOC122506320 [Leptopilina heterotoma]